MTKEQKEWIDNSDYHALLEKWRYAPMGDPMFQDACGEYYRQTMIKRREAVGNDHVRISKDIGWEAK